MSVDETLMCSFQILKPLEKQKFATYANAAGPGTPQHTVKVGFSLAGLFGQTYNCLPYILQQAEVLGISDASLTAIMVTTVAGSMSTVTYHTPAQ